MNKVRFIFKKIISFLADILEGRKFRSKCKNNFNKVDRTSNSVEHGLQINAEEAGFIKDGTWNIPKLIRQILVDLPRSTIIVNGTCYSPSSNETAEEMLIKLLNEEFKIVCEDETSAVTELQDLASKKDEHSLLYFLAALQQSIAFPMLTQIHSRIDTSSQYVSTSDFKTSMTYYRKISGNVITCEMKAVVIESISSASPKPSESITIKMELTDQKTTYTIY